MGHGAQPDVRHFLPTSLALALVIVALVGAAGLATAGAATGTTTGKPTTHAVKHPVDHSVIASAAVVAAVAGYRQLTWTYDRIAHLRRVRATQARKHSAATPHAVLELWKQRADTARRAALATLSRTIGVRLPVAPGRHASAARRRGYSKRLALALERIFPAPEPSSRSLSSARTAPPTFAFWQSRAAAAALGIARYAPRPLFTRDRLLAELMCIHHHEGRWTSNTGNGYYGGLQMNIKFQLTFGSAFFGRWGTADNWPIWAQVVVARRAYSNGLGFTPWPNTSRVCGL
jgi:hypothetical protein